MASKLRRANGAIKDQTSLGLARVFFSSEVAIAVLRATSHDDHPADEACIAQILLLGSSSLEHSAATARVLSRRLSRTRNWVVAVKSLCVVSRAISEFGSSILVEALSSNNYDDGGDRLLDLSGFHDESALSSPWDFAAFVRTLALYLDYRLQASVTGELPRRFNRGHIFDLKPPVLLDRIGQWRRLLDWAMGSRPTGPARGHRLIRTAFASVVRESFDLYRDISDALSLLLDSFFHLPRDLCSETFRHSAAAARLFDELESFYAGCKEMGIGRHSEYPSIRKISDSTLEKLEDFMKQGKARNTPPKHSPSAQPQSLSKAGSSPVLEKESWEIALLESVKEWSTKSLPPGAKATASEPLTQKSLTKKKGFVGSFHNPFLNDAYDKSLMAVTPSLSSFRAAPPVKDLEASQSFVEKFWSKDYTEKTRSEKEEKEEDAFDQLARHERPELISPADKEFREKYHRQSH